MCLTHPEILKRERYGVPPDPPEEKTGCQFCGKEECVCKNAVLAKIREELETEE